MKICLQSYSKHIPCCIICQTALYSLCALTGFLLMLVNFNISCRRVTHHIGRVDQHGKRRFNAQVVDAMQRKPPVEDSSNELLAKSLEITSSILGQTIQTSIEPSDKFASNLSGKNDEELSVLDQSDSEAQVCNLVVQNFLCICM